jgi:hypothetical protein
MSQKHIYKYLSYDDFLTYKKAMDAYLFVANAYTFVHNSDILQGRMKRC